MQWETPEPLGPTEFTFLQKRWRSQKLLRASKPHQIERALYHMPFYEAPEYIVTRYEDFARDLATGLVSKEKIDIVVRALARACSLMYDKPLPYHRAGPLVDRFIDLGYTRLFSLLPDPLQLHADPIVYASKHLAQEARAQSLLMHASQGYGVDNALLLLPHAPDPASIILYVCEHFDAYLARASKDMLAYQQERWGIESFTLPELLRVTVPSLDTKDYARLLAQAPPSLRPTLFPLLARVQPTPATLAL